MAPPIPNKKILEEFIEIYRSQPCLWQIKHKDYHTRNKKEAAYKLLIEKLKEIDPDADKEAVVKKINNLRSNVRKELKKYEQSIKPGSSADDVYRSKLWYYKLFDFVHDQSTPRERDHIKRPRPIITQTEDRCDIIGKNVTMKLRTLDAKQIIVAEKLINDLLFEAEIGHLTPEHAYINMSDILKQHLQYRRTSPEVVLPISELAETFPDNFKAYNE